MKINQILAQMKNFRKSHQKNNIWCYMYQEPAIKYYYYYCYLYMCSLSGRQNIAPAVSRYFRFSSTDVINVRLCWQTTCLLSRLPVHNHKANDRVCLVVWRIAPLDEDAVASCSLACRRHLNQDSSDISPLFPDILLIIHVPAGTTDRTYVSLSSPTFHCCVRNTPRDWTAVQNFRFFN